MGKESRKQGYLLFSEVRSLFAECPVYALECLVCCLGQGAFEAPHFTFTQAVGGIAIAFGDMETVNHDRHFGANTF